MDREHIEWSRRHFATMKDGGVWGVPRSGLVFQRQGAALVLIEQMPWIEDMPLTKAQLAEQQQGDFDVIQKYFGAAGITVLRQEAV